MGPLFNARFARASNAACAIFAVNASLARSCAFTEGALSLRPQQEGAPRFDRRTLTHQARRVWGQLSAGLMSPQCGCGVLA